MIRSATALVAACGLLAACSSSGHSKESTSSTPSVPSASVSSSTAYLPATGDDAALIAEHIAGCTGVHAGDAGGGSKTGLRSTATCTLDGHLLIVDSFATTPEADISIVAGTTTTYAHGDAWDVFLADQGQTADTTTLQMQITNDAAGLLEQSTGQTDTPVPADADAQQTILTKVVADLQGQLLHGTAS